MKGELPDCWIEVGHFDPLRFKAHFNQYSSVWFPSLEEAWGWAWRIYLQEKDVDTPKAEGVSQS